MNLGVLTRIISSDCSMKTSAEQRPFGWKRVFVQTDKGCVMGVDLDRGDNAHTVKRKIQIALNIPTDESHLTFGDQVLNSDLSSIRNDSPLRLTRINLHRSASNPCLSPADADTCSEDHSGPIEILGCSIQHCSRMKQLVDDVVKAIRGGVEPVPVNSGMGGAYFFMNAGGERVAIIKPTDEEPFAPNNPKGVVGMSLGQPGLKSSVRVGETGFREVAAYLLDYDNFAKVPPTVLIKITHSVFHINDGVTCTSRGCDRKDQAVSKIASFQQYISHDYDASDHGTSSFPVSDVHRIGILDIRIFNTDRHAGNLLVRKFRATGDRFAPQTELIPIDHGLCLPESLEDPYFEWIHWPQASIAFTSDELEYIAKLDPVKDCEMLRRELPMIREACLRVLIISTVLLKEAADSGLTLAEIGEMMSRQFTGLDEEPSELEIICIEARKLVDKSESSPATPSPKTKQTVEAFTQLGLDCKKDDDCREEQGGLNNPLLPSIVKLSSSLKTVGINGKAAKPSFGGIPKPAQVTKANARLTDNHAELPYGSRSANEQLQLSTSFVKLADMGDEQWCRFLERFAELLPGAIHARKNRESGQRQKQRLGASCKF